MNQFNPLSLSLQKEIANRNICLESEIDKSITKARTYFRAKTLKLVENHQSHRDIRILE